MNPLLLSDSYKVTQWQQMPPGTTKVYSYLESRGGRWPETVFFGLQYILKKYLTQRVTAEDYDEASALFAQHFGNDKLFNAAGWRHLIADHSGHLPLSIKAVPEGTVVPTHNVLMTVENTCPRCFWLTNYVETLLVQCWYPIAVATQSREIKRIIKGCLEKTGDVSGLPFKLHDFGYRGVSSVESAGIGGLAHLVNFMGTDTLAALATGRQYYDEQCAGYSIPASEHSTITSWGHEVDAFRNMLEQYPTGLMACVSDSFNIYEACSKLWGGALRDQVLERDGCLVVRPDSGDPLKVVLDVVTLLGDAFGYTYNEKGYKVLNPKVRVIQGDGVNIDSIASILRDLTLWGWSADNVAFGMGGALLQKLDRDTQKMAFKCSYVEGHTMQYGAAEWPWSRDVWKDPITDPGKTSKRGKLMLVKRGGTLVTEPMSLSKGPDELVEVFRDGHLLINTTLADVRQRAAL